MTTKFDGSQYIIRLNKGESLMASLTEFVQKEGIKGAWVNGVGGASSAELGYFNLQTKAYEWRTFSELMEVTSLQGNLATHNGELAWHLHATVSDRNFQAFGGHVKELIVGATLEILLRRFVMPLERTQDEETGLNLLDL
ncbi:MAG TPA: PPC domain-containing DNA-binding protein [Candidatus Saccharimonadales bacterium]